MFSKRVIALPLLAGVLLSLPACGSDEPAAEAPAAVESAKPTLEPTPEPTLEPTPEATPEQVASVIAGQVGEWSEVIDGAFDCRWFGTIGTESLAEGLDAMTCYTREITMGLTAASAVEDLEALDVPVSMSDLVASTSSTLSAIADIDLESVCGPAMELPSDSKQCRNALGERNTQYTLLKNDLAAWGPYL